MRYRIRVRGGGLALVVIAAAVGAVVVSSRAAGARVVQGAAVKIEQSPNAACPTAPVLEYCFDPASVRVPAGAMVTWTNDTGGAVKLARCKLSACNVQDGTGGGDAGFGSMIPGGGQYSFTFVNPGDYHYYCSNGGTTNMPGEVIAAASPTPSPVQLSLGPVTAPSSTPTPAPTPSPTPSPTPTPTDTPQAVAVATPNSDTPSAPALFPLATDGNSGSGPPLVIIVLVMLTLVAIGGGVLSFRLLRQ
ncbi:MAG: plastocyanin/azurin family copper-binding protein [Candidatus Dormibacter sp.]